MISGIKLKFNIRATKNIVAIFPENASIKSYNIKKIDKKSKKFCLRFHTLRKVYVT